MIKWIDGYVNHQKMKKSDKWGENVLSIDDRTVFLCGRRGRFVHLRFGVEKVGGKSCARFVPCLAGSDDEKRSGEKLCTSVRIFNLNDLRGGSHNGTGGFLGFDGKHKA